MIRRPPRSTLFPTRRSSDLSLSERVGDPSRGHSIPISGSLQSTNPSALGLYFAVHLYENSAWSPVTRKDRKSTRLNSSHANISYAVFCLKKKKTLTHYRLD